MPAKPYLRHLATAGKQVPLGPDWIHEVKHDGYRMLVIRENERVRMFSRNGTDWAKRYPWIAEAALKNRQKHFVVDGAVILGIDGISDLNALHSRKHEHDVQLYAFDVLPWEGTISARSRYTCARPTWSGSWLAGRTGSRSRRSSAAKSAPISIVLPAAWA